MKSCPFCAEIIQDAAIVCRYCKSPLAGAGAPPALSASSIGGPASAPSAVPHAGSSAWPHWFVLVGNLWATADDTAVIDWIRTRRIGPGTWIRHASWPTAQPLSAVRGFAFHLRRNQSSRAWVPLAVGGSVFVVVLAVVVSRRDGEGARPSSQPLSEAEPSVPSAKALPAAPTVTEPVARRKVPIEMNWAEAVAHLKALGYPRVRAEGGNVRWVRGDDEKCSTDSECRTRRPSMVFEFAEERDTNAAKCVTVFWAFQLDWRQVVRELSGADPSHLSAPKEETTVQMLGDTPGAPKVILYDFGSEVSVGKGCER